ncbi:nitroreductase family protein [Candidatus Neomicrothrix sp.]|uniref:Nitroreductase family protein n=1 Tax=Candidatus Neomicrothrix subdominans TaxID=2954438 RepID=A0A936TE00_9ACTN|nr:nitroreductase family protein [Candidatus Microthrix sp.]MBK9298166.1 nitroreductase family protein [Candidatus Microthrix subdominans]MBK6439012.1 nitroreductase family protein [Candidatus Microthrix sp.]MBK6968063.1 nitroreductase family protein [Candidatus Microthrix sp.]MBK7165308.1 nitroreductase family protein [Candidatus Microthrix sp.]MBP7596471.1 nitroreductase family protein [Candidatus Microthrix sp.]
MSGIAAGRIGSRPEPGAGDPAADTAIDPAADIAIDRVGGVARGLLLDRAEDDALGRVIGRRRMCRDYLADPLGPGQLEAIVDLARRAPSAGFSQGVAFVSLERPEPPQPSPAQPPQSSQSPLAQSSAEPDPVAGYWGVTLPPARRSEFPWPGLLDAPVLITLWVRPQAWVERYGRPDKARSGLGAGEASWPVPYWWVDAGAVVQNLLLVAEAEGLGALFFGMFEHEPAVAELLGVPDGWRAVGTVALGHPAPDGRRPSASASASGGRPALAEQWHRNAWSPAVSAPVQPPEEAR